MPKSTKTKSMQIIIACNLHCENGSRHTVAYPEYKWMKFGSEKEKEVWKRKTIREMFKDKSEHLEGVNKADFIVEFVELPDGQTELPEGWQPDPIPIPQKRVPEQPVSFELLDIKPFPYRKAKFKGQ